MPLHRRLASWLRRWALAPIAVAVLALMIPTIARVRRESRPVEVTIATGGNRGLRYHLVKSLAETSSTPRLHIRGIGIIDPEEMLGKLNAGKIQFAMIQGGLDLSRHPDLRQAAALNVEPLHLLVKEELHEAVSRRLDALKGKRIQLGSGPNTVGHRLALEILAFAGLKAGSPTALGDFTADRGTDLVRERRHDRLPDAVFIVSALPSATVSHLVTEQHYRLVALPFARAFTLGALSDAANKPRPDDTAHLLKDRVVATTIPAYTYRLIPPVPEADLPTFGIRIVLLTHRSVSPDTVERVLRAIYSNRLARAFQPPLTPSMMEGAQELPWHPGTIRFMERDKPLLTGALISNAANAIQLAAPALGALLCLWQWSRQRIRAQNEHTFEAYILKVARIEAEALELELTREHDLRAALRLRSELGTLKAEALRLFCDGELVGKDLMTNFLIQINDTRAMLSAMILRQRETETEPDPVVVGPSEAHNKGPQPC